MSMPRGPAPQRRVGVVASGDFDRDRELWRWVPDDVSLFITRTEQVPMDNNLAFVRALNQPDVLTRPARTLVDLGVETMLYACTACSFVGGADREHLLRKAMRAAGAPNAVTTAGAVLEALSALRARRVAVVHPYASDVAERLTAFLAAAGVRVVSSSAIDVAMDGLADVDYATVADVIRRGDHDAADALFISCTGLPTYDLIAPLEHELRKPVVTANQVGLWSLLRTIGRAAIGPGQALLQA